MTRSRELTLCTLTLILSLAWCSNLPADQPTPDDTLKSKSLTKVGSLYLLNDDANLPEFLRLVRGSQNTLTSNLKQRASIDADLQSADASIAQWDREIKTLTDKQEKVKKNPIQYNEYGGQINALGARIREMLRTKAEQEANLKKLPDPRDDYVGLVIDLSDKMDAAARQYDALSKVADVTAALAHLNQSAPPRLKLGPSPQFAQELPRIRALRKAINSAAIQLNLDSGVPQTQVSLNGRASRLMVVDSGASLVSLSWDVAQDLGLTSSAAGGTIQLRAADGRTVTATLSTLKSIRLGQFTAENVPCAILPQNARGDCLLGDSFLRNFVCRIDLKAGVLNLTQVAVPAEAQFAADIERPAKQPTPKKNRSIFDFGDDDAPAATNPATKPPLLPEPPVVEVPPATTAPTTVPEVATTAPTTAPTVVAAAKQPVPPLRTRRKAQKLIEQVFADELKDTTPKARRALSNRLLAEAGKENTPPVDKFVLVTGAADAAEEAADLPLCFHAIAAMDAQFDVDALKLRTSAVIRAGVKADAPAATSANCWAALDLVEELVSADRFDDASRIAAMVKGAASSDPALAKLAQIQAKRIDAVASTRAKLANDFETLRATPNNPAANLAVGKFYCFHVGNWTRGLSLLAHGSDPNLKSLAQSDIANPTDSTLALDLAGKWWELADTEPAALPKAQLETRAAHWYAVALPSLSGLSRTLAERRIKESEANLPSIGGSKPAAVAGGVIDLLKLAGKTKSGSWTTGQNGLACPEGDNRLLLPYAPPEEYDVRLIFTRTGRTEEISVAVPLPQGTVYWMMGGWDNTHNCFANVAPDTVIHRITKDDHPRHDALANDVPNACVIQVRRGTVRALLNGDLVAELNGDGAGFVPRGSTMDGVSVMQSLIKSSATVSKFEVAEITGHGRVLGPENHAPTTPPTASSSGGLLETMHGSYFAKQDDGTYLLSRRGRITTPDSYSVPVAFEIVVMSDEKDLRLAYAADQIIFNWEGNKDQLRIDGGPAGGRHRKGAGHLPAGQWATIGLTVTRDEMIIMVDGVERYRTKADFSKVNEPLAISAANGDAKLKSVQVANPLSEDPSDRSTSSSQTIKHSLNNS